MVLIYILTSTILVSLIAFIGILFTGFKGGKLEKYVIFLVSLSAGGLLGGGFLHLLPEAVEMLDDISTYLLVIIGFLLFFGIEKVIDYKHCHNVEKDHICEFHAFRWLNLIGDGVHNLIDGLVIAAAFLVEIHLGMITTIAVILHEIPQEIGDYGVLVYGGFSKKRALFLNFITALTAIFGGFLGFYLISFIEPITPYLLAFAAGGFFYIAAADLTPELKKERSAKNNALIFGLVIFGIILMYLFKIIFSGLH